MPCGQEEEEGEGEEEEEEEEEDKEEEKEEEEDPRGKGLRGHHQEIHLSHSELLSQMKVPPIPNLVLHSMFYKPNRIPSTWVNVHVAR